MSVIDQNLQFVKMVAAYLRQNRQIPEAHLNRLPAAVLALRKAHQPVPPEVDTLFPAEDEEVDAEMPDVAFGVLRHLQPLMTLEFLNRWLVAFGQRPVELLKPTVLKIGRGKEAREVPAIFHRNKVTGDIFALVGRVEAETMEDLKVKCADDKFLKRAYNNLVDRMEKAQKRAEATGRTARPPKPVVKVHWTVPETLAIIRAGEVFFLGSGNGKVMLEFLELDGQIRMVEIEFPDPPNEVSDRVLRQTEALHCTMRTEATYQALLQATPPELRPPKLKNAEPRTGLEVPFGWDWGRRMAGLGGRVRGDRETMKALGLMQEVVPGQQAGGGQAAQTGIYTAPGARIVGVGRGWWPKGSKAPEIIQNLIEGGDRR